MITSLNPVGCQRNQSKQEWEKTSGNFKNIIAMNTLAGGVVKPDEASKYSWKLDVAAAVIGMSTKKHALESINAFRGDDNE